ncbi:MAG: ABC transporter ATP-binding protein [Dethiobacter sp.]|jgi:ABC-2 type transport system ATP-binding protein|nr:ABC transporter ATP-binding protein [Dethiobacter sp.]
MKALVTSNLTKFYGQTRGIEEVTLTVDQGEIFGFIGPNGAGKTTTIRTLMGLIRPTGGEAFIFDTPLPGGGGDLYRQVGYLPGEVNYYPEMTGREMIDYAARFYDAVDKKWVGELFERLQFDPSRRIRTYSTGNRKKLGVIQALLHKPRLAVLDEPTSGLDPLIKQEFFHLLQEMNNNGMTIFFSTHVLEEIERICHRVGVIKEGRLIQVAPLEELPGRQMKLITLRLAGGHPPDALPRRWSRFEPVEGKPGFFQLSVQAPANEITAHLSHLDLEYVKITDPSIEDLFLAMYGPEKGDGHVS